MLVAIGAAQLGRFGQTSADLHIPGVAGPEFSIAYTVVSSVVVLAWAFGLHTHGTRAPQRIGSGWPEYRQVVDASLRVFGIVAIAAFLLRIDVARDCLLIARPTGIALLVASRWAWRQWLGRQREHGRLLSRTVVLGEYAKTLHVARELLRDRTAGMLVIGAVTERRDGMLTADVPLVGSLDDALASIELSGSDAVVYCGSDQISPSEMRQLTWDLQSRNIELIVATTLTDVSGTRIHSRPVAGCG